MSRRTVIAVAGWLAAAVTATLIGVAAIRLIGESITGTPGGVLSEQEVAAALAAATPSATPSTTPSVEPPAEPSAQPSAEPSTAPPVTREQQTFAVSGGTAVASCSGDDRATLVTWAPAQGWHVAKYDRGPAHDVRVEFEGPGGKSELRIRCRNGVPVRDGGSGDD